MFEHPLIQQFQAMNGQPVFIEVWRQSVRDLVDCYDRGEISGDVYAYGCRLLLKVKP